MRRDDVLAKLHAFFATAVPDADGSLQDDADLFQAGVLDSLKIIELVLFVEKEFQLVLDYDDLTEKNLGSAAAIADLVVRKRAGSVDAGAYVEPNQ